MPLTGVRQRVWSGIPRDYSPRGPAATEPPMTALATAYRHEVALTPPQPMWSGG